MIERREKDDKRCAAVQEGLQAEMKRSVPYCLGFIFCSNSAV